MTVSCEPTQRAIVRHVVINGVTMSQVECTTTGVGRGTCSGCRLSARRGVRCARILQSDPAPALDDARVVHSVDTRVAARPVTYARTPERVAYRPSDRWPRAR